MRRKPSPASTCDAWRCTQVGPERRRMGQRHERRLRVAASDGPGVSQAVPATPRGLRYLPLRVATPFRFHAVRTAPSRLDRRPTLLPRSRLACCLRRAESHSRRNARCPELSSSERCIHGRKRPLRRSGQLTRPRLWLGASDLAGTCCCIVLRLAFKRGRSSSGVSLQASRARTCSGGSFPPGNVQHSRYSRSCSGL
jgi:hypothetical protein